MVSRTERNFEKALLNVAPPSVAGYSSSGDRQTSSEDNGKEHHSLQTGEMQQMLVDVQQRNIQSPQLGGGPIYVARNVKDCLSNQRNVLKSTTSIVLNNTY